MTEDKSHMTTTEMRQGNSRKMNLRVLVTGLVVVAVCFALVFWFSVASHDDTATTIGGGTTIEDIPSSDGAPDTTLENAPMPVPEGQ